MTHIALGGGRDVGGGFALGGNTVMATGAGTDDLGVIHGCRQQRCPGRESGVASFANIGGCDMPRGFRRGPHTGGMTQHAIIDNG